MKNFTVVNTGIIDEYTISIEVNNSDGVMIAKGEYGHKIHRCSNMSHTSAITLNERYDIELDIEHGRVVIF